MRMLFLRRVFLRDRGQEYWRPILASGVLGEPVPDHAMNQVEDFQVLIEEWNNLHERLRGDATDHLNELGRILKIDAAARAMLSSRSRRKKLLGIISLGHLRDPKDWKALVALLENKHTSVSLAAARSMVQLYAEAALPLVLAQSLQRPDWPPVRLANIIMEAGADVACQPLLDQIELAVDANHLATFLRFTKCLKCRGSLDAMLRALDISDDEKVVIACLDLLDDPRGLTMARWYVKDERWTVRVHAANALGRVGKREDIELLKSLLCDSEWWVRYRAAQALASLPFVDEAVMASVRGELDDNYARDILTQVIAENRVG